MSVETTPAERDWFAGDFATFGDRLTAAREAQRLSQSDLSRKLGVKLKTVQGWEQDTSEPRANKLQMVAGLLNVSMRWLLTGEGDGVSEPADDAVLAQDARTALAELRAVRAEMTRLANQLGVLEKRLRSLVRDAL